jgi:hypothetical protein
MRRALALVLLVAAVSAEAVDGVLEINQACAAGSGCFPGDGPDFPVEITSAGSYRLTGNISVTDDSADALAIQTSHTTLDLNGFAVAGPDSGTGRGVVVDGAHAVIRNGIVRDFGGIGITGSGSAVRIEEMRIVSNAGSGIDLGAGAQVLRCAVISNGGHGVVVGNIGGGSIDSVSRVEDSIVRDSFGDGIQLINADALNNQVDHNRQRGIVADGACLIRGNHVQGNGPALALPFAGGIVDGATISPDHLRIIGNLITRNGEDNVRIDSSGNLIEDNAMDGGSATKYGLRITTSGNVYSGNRFTSHATADTSIAGGNVDGGSNLSY